MRTAQRRRIGREGAIVVTWHPENNDRRNTRCYLTPAAAKVLGRIVSGIAIGIRRASNNTFVTQSTKRYWVIM